MLKSCNRNCLVVTPKMFTMWLLTERSADLSSLLFSLLRSQGILNNYYARGVTHTSMSSLFPL